MLIIYRVKPFSACGWPNVILHNNTLKLLVALQQLGNTFIFVLFLKKSKTVHEGDPPWLKWSQLRAESADGHRAVRISHCHTTVHHETAWDANTSKIGLIAPGTARKKEASFFHFFLLYFFSLIFFMQGKRYLKYRVRCSCASLNAPHVSLVTRRSAGVSKFRRWPTVTPSNFISTSIKTPSAGFKPRELTITQPSVWRVGRLAHGSFISARCKGTNQQLNFYRYHGGTIQFKAPPPKKDLWILVEYFSNEIKIKPTIQGYTWCWRPCGTWRNRLPTYAAREKKGEKKKVEENFNQRSVNNTFSDAMLVAITSNAAIKTNSNAAFIHCCNHTAFCRVEWGKQRRAEETRRDEGNQALPPVPAAPLKMQRSSCLYNLRRSHAGTCVFTHFCRYFVELYPSVHQFIIV